ncbi:CRISPR-associated endonuclease Cas2 [Rhodocista pekingensis]|uniref:CRISPR-associated endoribonuclease Cas2 n=1 Tax=Rhodocista pekingensis TaxID=201185 RepID=A0ABW2KXG3_9PROT
MWVMVLFDLPVLTKSQRKAATRFRNDLLDLGFEMSQFSVYLRHFAGKEQAEVAVRKIGAVVPATGAVHVLTFTDRQYAAMVCFDGRTVGRKKSRDQFVLF